MNGRNGLIDKGSFLNPQVMRVPLILRPPTSDRLEGRGKAIESLSSLLDLAPPDLKIAGIKIEERLDGLSLFELLRWDIRPGDKPVLFEVWNHVIPNPCIGTVFSAADGVLYSFTYNTTDDLDELFRLGSGDELVSLIDSERMEAIRSEALQAMAASLVGDPRWFGYSQY